jgi:hypothetical protein
VSDDRARRGKVVEEAAGGAVWGVDGAEEAPVLRQQLADLDELGREGHSKQGVKQWVGAHPR